MAELRHWNWEYKPNFAMAKLRHLIATLDLSLGVGDIEPRRSISDVLTTLDLLSRMTTSTDLVK